jgi:hypothetical protein
MININDHVEEINGKKYVPYDIAIKVINQQYSKELSETMTDFRNKITDAFKDIGNIDD